MSVAFLYESAKDVLRWHNLSVKTHINEVMSIGSLIYLSDENYNKHRAKISEENSTTEDIDDAFAKWNNRNK